MPKISLHSLGRLLLWLSVLGGGTGQIVAQPTGCASRYSGTSFSVTTSPEAGGFYGEYYAGQFQATAGFAENNPVTFFANYAGVAPVRLVDGTINFTNGNFNTPVKISKLFRKSVV